MLFLTDPDFIRGHGSFWSDFLSDVLAEILKRTSIDVLYLCEDMAYKEHSFISPDMTREFPRADLSAMDRPGTRGWMRFVRHGFRRLCGRF